MKHFYKVTHNGAEITRCGFADIESAEEFIKMQNNALFPLDFPVSELKIVEEKVDECDWTTYVPEKTWLYYVDYRDNLNSCTDLIQQCIDKNELCPLTEKMYDWWDFPEEDELRWIEEEMSRDGYEEEFREHRDEIRDLLWERDESEPLKSLLYNTGFFSCFYDLDYWFNWGWGTRSQMREAIKKKLGIKDHSQDAEVESLIANAYSGCLRIYFPLDTDTFMDDLVNCGRKEIKQIEFCGEFAVGIINGSDGGGFFTSLKLNVKLPFLRGNVYLSKEADRYPLEDICGMSDRWIKEFSAPIFSEKLTTRRKIGESSQKKTMSMEKEYKLTFKQGGCTLGDTNIDRHRGVYYRNEPPFCALVCPHCGQEWID